MGEEMLSYIPSPVQRGPVIDSLFPDHVHFDALARARGRAYARASANFDEHWGICA